MARTGKFGRLPRAAPDLTATIVSLYEAYESQRDRNILSAWQEGGDFEGKPVTDKRLLQWFQMRRDGVSKQDPMWDYWNDLHNQYEFSIDESKVLLRYAREGMTAGEVSQFYKDASKKYPVASEAWRSAQKHAAQYAAIQRNANAAGAAQAKADAYARQDKALYQEYNRAGETVGFVMTEIARAFDIVPPGNGVTGNGRGELSDLQASQGDYSRYAEVLDALGDPTQLDPGQMDLRAWAIKTIQKDDPNFDGTFDIHYLDRWMRRSDAGYTRRIQLAKRYGYDSNVDTLRKQRAGVRQGRKFLRTLDERQAYEHSRADMEEVWNDPTSTPAERLAAAAAHAATLNSLEQSVVKDDRGLYGMFRNERLALQGDEGATGITVWEDSSGAASDSNANDAASTAQSITALRAVADRVNDDPTLLIVPDSNDPSGWNTLSPSEAQQAYGAAFAVTVRPLPGFTEVRVPPKDGTESDTTADGKPKVRKGEKVTFPGARVAQGVQLKPVVATLNSYKDPRTGAWLGAEVTPNQDSVIAYSGEVNGKTVWKVPMGDGTYSYYTHNPFSDLVVGGMQPGQNGELRVFLDPGRAISEGVLQVPAGKDAPKDASELKNFTFDPTKALDSKVINESPGWVNVDVALAASDPKTRKALANMTPDEAWDLYSPTATTIAERQLLQGQLDIIFRARDANQKDFDAAAIEARQRYTSEVDGVPGIDPAQRAGAIGKAYGIDTPLDVDPSKNPLTAALMGRVTSIYGQPTPERRHPTSEPGPGPGPGVGSQPRPVPTDPTDPGSWPGGNIPNDLVPGSGPQPSPYPTNAPRGVDGGGDIVPITDPATRARINGLLSGKLKPPPGTPIGPQGQSGPSIKPPVITSPTIESPPGYVGTIVGATPPPSAMHPAPPPVVATAPPPDPYGTAQRRRVEGYTRRREGGIIIS